MDDLLTEKGQKEAEDFFRYLIWSVENNQHEPFPQPQTPCAHTPVTVPECSEEKLGDVVIVTDCREDENQLKDMIARFRAVFPRKTRIVNLWDYPFKGGCLGCFNCAVSGKCIYKDGFDSYLRDIIQTADAIVYAFTVKDHSMGARFKLYDDRQFCNGHRTVTIGMPVGYLVSGNYAQEMNLQMIVEGRAQVGTNFLAGVATDEGNTDESIDWMAASLAYALDNKYVPPQNFYGIGGMKIFRDLIWLMQGMMKADHKFYKAHGQYDFPQKKRGTMLKMYLVGALLSSEKIKAKMGNAMNEGMLMPYNKLFQKMDKK
jgi:multimeric flavodoxin WrbA